MERGLIKVISVLAAILLLVACGNGGNDHDNLRPQADAGIDQSVKAGAQVTMDGSSSRDSDGNITTFSWVQSTGPDVFLSNPNQAVTAFTAPEVSSETVLVFRLTVTDNEGATGSDEIRIHVRPAQATAASGMESRPVNQSCLAPERPVPGSAEIEIRAAFPQLTFTQPLAMMQAPGNHGRWYVVERGGYVRTFTGGESRAAIFVDLTDRVLAPSPAWSEQGLLGMAFHPRFATNRFVYLSYTRKPDGVSVIARFTASQDGLSLNPASEQVILTVDQPAANHNGGGIAFGPDGFLYIGFGDGGGAGDEDNNAQNTGNLLGAMLRIDVDRSAGGRPYAIPSDNPFATSSDCASGQGCPEIWAWGLRNPWRWSFDRETGKLWAGDVGQDAWEEVDIVENGKNYGWRCYEGNHEYNTAGCATRGSYTFPVVEYGHDDKGGFSITGGYVYRGSAIPALQGTYLYADFGSGRVWGLPVEGGTPKELISTDMSIASFAEGNDGEIHLLDYAKGSIHKIVPKGGVVSNSDFPQKLSETGCFQANDPTQPVSGLIPYGVNAPLWSDDAEKYRWFAIPDGTAIQIDDDGNNWIFPPGSVLIKEFRLAGKRVETRLLIRHNDGVWAGYSYEWDDQEQDATLLAGAKSKVVAGQVWDYPSPAQCMFCHTEAAGYALGPETIQLNGLFAYTATGSIANQLATYEAIGLFAAPLLDRPENLPALANFMDPAESQDDRARSYLHANCSSCHRPGAIELADFRYDTSLREMGICNAEPVHNDMGIGSAARLLVPGSPANSILLARMKTTEAGRMPMLGTRVVDPVGVTVVEKWITALSGCP